MSGRLCVDASVAAKWVLPEDDSKIADDIRCHARDAEIDLVVPGHLPSEVTNAVHQRVHRGMFGLADARDALAAFASIPLWLVHSQHLIERAFELATTHGLSTPYDAFYLALAEELDCELWTADERFHRAVASTHSRVRLLSEWSV